MLFSSPSIGSIDRCSSRLRRIGVGMMVGYSDHDRQIDDHYHLVGLRTGESSYLVLMEDQKDGNNYLVQVEAQMDGSSHLGNSYLPD